MPDESSSWRQEIIAERKRMPLRKALMQRLSSQPPERIFIALLYEIQGHIPSKEPDGRCVSCSGPYPCRALERIAGVLGIAPLTEAECEDVENAAVSVIYDNFPPWP